MSMLSGGGGGISAGTAYVDILPSFGSNFGGQLAAGVQQASRQAGATLEQNLTQSANRANSTMQGVGRSMMMLGGQAGPLGEIFTQLGSKIQLGFDTGAKAAESARSRIGGALQGIGLAASALGAIFQGFAGPLEKATAGLTAELGNVGQATADNAAKLRAAEKDEQKYGATITESTKALAALVGATGNVDQSIKELGDAELIAKVRHIDLADAATKLAAAHAGSFKAAKQLGIDLTGVKDATKIADAADKAYLVTVQSLDDAQQRLSDFEARVTEKRAAAAEAYAANVTAANERIAASEQSLADVRDQNAQNLQAANDKIASDEQNIADLRQSFVDSATSAAETEADRVVQARQREQDAIQAVIDAQATAADQQQQASQSLLQARQRLSDLERSQGLTNNPKAAAADARQVALRNAQEAVVAAQSHVGEVAESNQKLVAKAQANVAKVVDANAQADEKALRDETRRQQSEAKQLQKAQDQLVKDQAAREKVADADQKALLRAQQQLVKDQAALAKIREKGDGSKLTLAEQQQLDNLTRTRDRAAAKEAEAAAAKVKADQDVLDNQTKREQVFGLVDTKGKGVPEAERHTLAGKIDAVGAGIKSFLETVGQKVAGPLMAAGPLAFMAGLLLKGRGASGIASAAGGLGGAGNAVSMAGRLGAVGSAPLAVGTDVGAAFAATAPAAGAAGAEGAAGLLAMAGPAAIVIAAVAAIGAGLYELYKHSKGFHDFVDGAWQKTQEIVKGAWHDVIQPVWNEMWHVIADYVIPWYQTLWHVAVDVFHFISDVISFAWRNVIKPVFDFLYGFVRDYLIVEFWLLKTGCELVWAAIKDAISIAWHMTIKPIWDLLVGYVNGVLVPVFHFIYDNAVKPVMELIGTAIGLVWRNVIKPVWDELIGFIHNDLLPVFHKIGEIWSGVWDGVKSTITDAVKFIGGLVADFLHTVATIAGAVGAGNIQKTLDKASGDVRNATSGPGAPPPTGPGRMAAGGALGRTRIGAGFVTDAETAIVHEGGPYPEFVVPTDPAHRGNARRLFRELGAKLMAAGGALGWPFPTHGSENRVDEGWDLQEGPGGPVLAVAAGTLGMSNRDPGGFGNDYPWEMLDAPPPGALSNTVYYGHIHALANLIGAHVAAGQQIGVTNTTDPQNGSAAPPGWLEIGFAQSGSGNPLQHGSGATAAGAAMKALLTGATPPGGGGFLSGVGNAVAGLVSNALSAAVAALNALPALDVPDNMLGIFPAAANSIRQAVIDHLGAGVATSGEQTGGLLGVVGLTAGPVGAINNPNDFAVNLLQALGDPVTPANVASIVNWERREGGNWNNSARFNPLNTTQPEPGASSMNSVGVKAYTSWQQGIQATLTAMGNGRYGDILAALHSGSGLGTGHYPGLMTWSGNGYDHLARGGVLGAHWAGSMDSGGVVPPGAFVGVNNTGRDENLRPVNDSGGIDYERLAASIAAALARTPPNVIIDGKQLSRSLQDRRLAYS